jgi:hypothetical protein
MTDDERRLLLACASCLLANLVDSDNRPSTETQIRVLRSMIEPFTEFMREDVRRVRRDD